MTLDAAVLTAYNNAVEATCAKDNDSESIDLSMAVRAGYDWSRHSRFNLQLTSTVSGKIEFKTNDYALVT